LHEAFKTRRFVLGEIHWLIGARSPARRGCSFQKLRALSEEISVDGETLLIGSLAGEYFESFFEAESVAISDARDLRRVLGDILDTLSRRWFVRHVVGADAV
jgi:hypothetical protein